jgi:uncharacterized membrane protein YfcA
MVMIYEYLILSVLSFIAGGLTLFTGFGLATLLLPVFTIFLPIEIAVASTAVVHLINNLYKFFIFFKNTNWRIVVSFGINAAIAAVIGSLTLNFLSLQSQKLDVVMGTVIIFIALFEISPLRKLEIKPKYLPLGGLISGFFGGFSGHQGMFRSIFLVKSGLDTKKFIATGVAIAVLVDITRLTIYGNTIFDSSVQNFQQYLFPIFISTLSAIFGVWMATDLVTKMNIKIITNFIAFLMIVIGLLLIFQVI